MSNKLTADRVNEVFTDCLLEDATDTVEVEGIVHPVVFSRAKLDKYRTEIGEMLVELPLPFQPVAAGGGGGWSFLNACQDRDDNQWTGLHWTMEMLFQLGIGTDQAKWLMPRDMWSAFPGGMPYVAVFPKENHE